MTSVRISFPEKGRRFGGRQAGQRGSEPLAVEPVDEKGADGQERPVGDDHQYQPAAPGDAADQGGRQDRGDPARQQDGGGQSVDRAERQHDRLDQGAAAGRAAQIQRLLVHMDEDPRAGRRRGEQEREERKGEQQVQVQGPRAPLTVAEEEQRHPLGEAAVRDRQAERQDPDEEIGHRFGETHQRFPESRNAAREGEGDDHQEPRDRRRDHVGAPQADRQDGHRQNPLSGRREAGGERCEHQGYGQSDQKNRDQECLPLLLCRDRSVVPGRSVFTILSLFHGIRRFDRRGLHQRGHAEKPVARGRPSPGASEYIPESGMGVEGKGLLDSAHSNHSGFIATVIPSPLSLRRAARPLIFGSS